MLTVSHFRVLKTVNGQKEFEHGTNMAYNPILNTRNKKISNQPIILSILI
jgi:hypothetical protein